jgi:hypothetical protein
MTKILFILTPTFVEKKKTLMRKKRKKEKKNYIWPNNGYMEVKFGVIWKQTIGHKVKRS